jgi:WD40 repeat protein
VTVRVVVFSPDGQHIASGSDDGTIKVWRILPLQRSVAKFSTSGPVTRLVFSPDNRHILTNQGSFSLLPSVRELEGGDGGPDSILHVRGQWIYTGQTRLLRIADTYEVSSWAVIDQTVALGLESGSVLRISFRFS